MYPFLFIFFSDIHFWMAQENLMTGNEWVLSAVLYATFSQQELSEMMPQPI